MPLPTSELANYPNADAKEAAAIKADQYAQLESLKQTLLGMSAGLTNGTLAPKSAVITSADATKKTTQNITDLTSATTPPPPLTPEQQAVKDKAAADKLAAENAAKEKSATDTAINGALGGKTPQKSQAEIDAEAGAVQTKTELETLQKTMDARSSSIIAGITAEYDNIIKAQEAQNKAYEAGTTTEGLRSGRARYAPIMQAGIIDRAVSGGLEKISSLQAKKQQLILEAEAARDDRNLKALNTKMELYRETIKEERRVAQQTYENAIRASAEARDIAKLNLLTEASGLSQLNKAGYAMVGGEIIPTLDSMKEQRIAETPDLSIQVDKNGVVTALNKKTGETVWRTEAGVGRSGSASPNILVNSIADPVTGTPQAIQIIDKDTGDITYKDPTTGEEISPDKVQLKEPQDPLDKMINDIISESITTQ